MNLCVNIGGISRAYPQIPVYVCNVVDNRRRLLGGCPRYSTVHPPYFFKYAQVKPQPVEYQDGAVPLAEIAKLKNSLDALAAALE